jgi:hypothetical protein
VFDTAVITDQSVLAPSHNEKNRTLAGDLAKA